MTPIPSTDAWAGRDSWESSLVSAIGDYGTLAARSWDDIRKIEFLPGIQVGSPLYEVPEHWLPQGALRRLSTRTIDPTLRSQPASDALSLEDESIRRSLFAVALPRRTMTGIRRFKPTSWLSCARSMLRMARWIAESRPSGDGRLWSHLQPDDWQAMLSETSDSERMRTTFVSIVRMLEDLGRRGVICDYPVTDRSAEFVFPTPELDFSGSLETSHRNQPVVPRLEKTEAKSFQPLPDGFVTKIVERARWLQDNVADQLLDCWADLRKANEHAASLGRRQSHPTTTRERRAIIEAVIWKDAAGKPLTRLPWPVAVREGGSVSQSDAWPPRDPAGINMMVGALQALNFCTVALCTGARSSELLSATDGSLRDDDGRLHAKTFKLVDDLEGVERDWPLHPVAVQALRIQQRIADVVRPEGADHLWVLLSKGSEPAGSPMRNVTEPLVVAAAKFGLESETGGIRPHAHRWRHTVGRLVALSVSSAPQVLMDLFGHRDLEMTLRYMLASPQMAEDVMRIAAEAAHSIAAEAISDADAGIAGGPASAPLEIGIESFRMRRGEEEFDAESMREAIEILTFNGRHWQVVRPGVLCTKTLGQFGPCTMGRGDADPGSCHTTCDHRLETARAKAHCEAALDRLLEEHAEAVRQEQEMVAESLEGQILASLNRWDDVRERALSRSAVAGRIWEARVHA